MTGEILKIEDGKVTIGVDDGHLIRIPIADISYLGPKVGDRVRLFRDKDHWAASGPITGTGKRDYYDGRGADYRNTQRQSGTYEKNLYPGRDVRVYNKHVFTWLFTIILGWLGVDRFCRGQVGLGILKLFTMGEWGIWWLVDVVNALGKAYGLTYKDTSDFTFVDGHYSR